MLTDTGVSAVMEALSEIRLDTTQSFTAYDVTKAARSLTDENIRHPDVRDLVHALYENDFLEDYFRASHTFWSDGRQETAQLFTPLGADPDDYDPHSIQLKKRSAVAQAVKNVTGVISTDNPNAIFGSTGIMSIGPSIADDIAEGTIGVTGMQAAPAPCMSEEDVVDPFTPTTKNDTSVIPSPIQAAKPASHQPPEPKPFTVTATGGIQVDPMALIRKIKDRISQLPIPRLFKDDTR